MLVLGIDPGTRHLGWGLVSCQGSAVRHVEHGVVDTRLEGSLTDRLLELDLGLTGVLSRRRPDAAAVETLFFAKGAQSAAKLGHARGVVLLALGRAGVPTFEYPPAQVKRAVVGRGAADKRQVSHLVATILELREPPRPDAADALALALTHVRVSPFASLLQSRRR